MSPAPVDDDSDPRRRLIPVYTILEDKRVQAMIEEFSRTVVLEAVKEAADSFRREFAPGGDLPDIDEAVARVRALVQQHEGERLRPVINATGIILHTGLGRAVLSKPVVDALQKLDRCCNTQVDLDTGKRGARNEVTEYLLTKLTGAEAAMVVNNNAAATYLILAALCAGSDVLVSIGQLIEIGGSFRLPDCIRQSGAELVLVGTTNRTHLRDYEQALSERTGAIFRANPSNYRVMGFTKEVSIRELVSLKKKHEHPLVVIDDLGCGALVDMTRFNLPAEGTVQESIAAGADLACFSGDKLIGGPQAGIIVGRKDLVAKIKKHPLTRMMRVCKLTDLALEQTLRLFLDEETLVGNNPTLSMLAATTATLEERAKRLKSRIDADQLPLTTEVKQDASQAGGGAMPVTPIDTFVLAVSSPSLAPDRLSQLLRKNEPPIISRISEGDIIIDVRTLLAGDDEEVHLALRRIARSDA